jgi:hypothetical protein
MDSQENNRMISESKLGESLPNKNPNPNPNNLDESVIVDYTVIDYPFSRTNVVLNESKIRLVDKDEETGLDLFCYIRCSNDEVDFIKQCRGLVYHGDKLIMKAFSYTSEYAHDEIETINTVLSDFDKYTFYKAYEGALIRMFYFGNRWYVSTHRKLNAFRSKWASKESFGILFKKALECENEINKNFRDRIKNMSEDNILEKFQSTLDKEKQYMFLLRNNVDNRIVSQPPSPFETRLYHVGTFVNSELTLNENVGISHPEKVSFTNVKQLSEYISTNINPKSHQGIVCFGPNNYQVKVLHRDYLEMSRVRGNEPSIKFRYLQVRMNKKLTELLYELYPEQKTVFDEYERIIYDIANGIYKAYVQRFIKKNYITVPVEEYQVVKACHSWHLSDKENNRISLERVIKTLNEQSATNINHMIHRYKIEQSKKDETVPRTIRGSRFSSPMGPIPIGNINSVPIMNM